MTSPNKRKRLSLYVCPKCDKCDLTNRKHLNDHIQQHKVDVMTALIAHCSASDSPFADSQPSNLPLLSPGIEQAESSLSATSVQTTSSFSSEQQASSSLSAATGTQAPSSFIPLSASPATELPPVKRRPRCMVTIESYKQEANRLHTTVCESILSQVKKAGSETIRHDAENNVRPFLTDEEDNSIRFHQLLQDLNVGSKAIDKIVNHLNNEMFGKNNSYKLKTASASLLLPIFSPLRFDLKILSAYKISKLKGTYIWCFKVFPAC